MIHEDTLRKLVCCRELSEGNNKFIIPFVFRNSCLKSKIISGRRGKRKPMINLSKDLPVIIFSKLEKAQIKLIEKEDFR